MLLWNSRVKFFVKTIQTHGIKQTSRKRFKWPVQFVWYISLAAYYVFSVCSTTVSYIKRVVSGSVCKLLDRTSSLLKNKLFMLCFTAKFPFQLSPSKGSLATISHYRSNLHRNCAFAMRFILSILESNRVSGTDERVYIDPAKNRFQPIPFSAFGVQCPFPEKHANRVRY